MEFNNTSVGILQSGDFNAQGILFTRHPVLILIYGSHCPYCQQEIPAFIQLAARGQNVLCAAIPTEGPNADPALLQRLSSIIPGIRGVPTFALFVNGHFVASARKAEDLIGKL